MDEMTNSRMKLCEDCKSRFSLVEKVVNSEPPVKKLRDDVVTCCQACFGLSSKIEEVVAQVETEYRLSGYQSVDTFALCISIRSLALLVYQPAIWHYYLGKDGYELGHSTPPPTMTIKNSLKAKLSQRLEKVLHLQHSTDSLFEVTIAVDAIIPSEVITLLHSLQDKQQVKKKNKSNEFSLSQIASLLSNVTAIELQQSKLCPPPVIDSCDIVVTFYHQPLFIGGRYNKYSRELSQSPWIVDGVKKTEYSVQELIVPAVKQTFGCREIKFSSSGREDSDVKMLGNGRPFLLELLEPKVGCAGYTSGILSEVEQTINDTSLGLIRIRNLKWIDKGRTTAIKQGEENKVKYYSALVVTTKHFAADQLCFLNDTKELEISQKTPIRVLHRRPLIARQKTIHSMKAQYINEKHFLLHLCTSAGTYVKEFVHSDFGRTVPSLCSILKQQVHIINLDVEEVEMDWP